MRHLVRGAIRRMSAGHWEAIADVGHRPEGIASVELVAGAVPRKLRIVFDFTAEYVISGQTAPDEILARNSIVPGASVGYGSALIQFGKNGVQIDPETITAAGANFWVDFELGTDDPPEEES